MVSSNDALGECALCRQQRKLCHSHIVPEFAYKGIYDEKHKLVTFHPASPDKIQSKQKGLREYLLCIECEQFINDEYEKPFKALWVDNDALAIVEHKREAILRDVDYRCFKLFHLSVLFRADAAKWVDLGPHRETIREMLLQGEAGPAWKYPIICQAIEFEGKIMEEFVTSAFEIRLGGHRGYMLVFLGVEWVYFVSSHRCTPIEQRALKEDGSLPIARRAPQFHLVGRALRSQRSNSETAMLA